MHYTVGKTQKKDVCGGEESEYGVIGNNARESLHTLAGECHRYVGNYSEPKGRTKREYIYYVNNFVIFVGKAILEPK